MEEARGWLGRRIADFLTKELDGYSPSAPPDPEALARVLQPGDVLLVEGNTRIASIIKYMTQSTWSHAALYVGDIPGTESEGEAHTLIEADVKLGIVSVPLAKYEHAHVRICRPVAMTPKDRAEVVRFVTSRIGQRYDMKNVVDLARYLLPLPIPARFRRRMIAVGSGEPTRAICSTLIAEAFQHVRYPILPRIDTNKRRGITHYARAELIHIRHHSLYAPRDFDISPYFAILKPTIEMGFDYKRFIWRDDSTGAGAGERQVGRIGMPDPPPAPGS
ncbi:YiiX/YebB-like N1pC/P60 family cysteine hydrolase [Chelatococcus reniformis]|uniref:Lipo-like protein n=1 Tax=Chelatococcus reniformis TaxID=1494448 RepID=A0A916TX83_9HYPH|nr:YiiX/YebB-like N1pC/P60 family cysteine hydrolase [Chelatococcus reniformis]GGC45551.1 hypothetical protein GCM10010994_00860 [Chelatococcus reniformis]